MLDKVTLTVSRPFGGSRIANGRAFADLWSDGVVLATAGTVDQPEIAGELFTFRGTLVRRSWVPRSRQWVVLRDGADAPYFGGFATRKDALDAVVSMVTLDAFRAMNVAQGWSVAADWAEAAR